MIAFGEENRDWGGAFAVYRGLTEALPYHRLFNSPISEAAIVGAAVGYALEGGRVVAELMYADFMGRAGDEIFNQLSKWQAMSAGQLTMPVVLRMSVGSKYGAQHSQDWTALVHHIPGPEGRLSGDAVRRQGHDERGARGDRSGDLLREPEGLRLRRDVRRAGRAGGLLRDRPVASRRSSAPGTDLTIVTLGPALYTAIAAADELQTRFGLSAEVIDLRAATPLNYEPAGGLGAQDRAKCCSSPMRSSAAA